MNFRTAFIVSILLNAALVAAFVVSRREPAVPVVRPATNEIVPVDTSRRPARTAYVPVNIYQAFDARRDAQRSAAEIMSNQTLDANQRQTALQNIRNNAELKWRNMLGAEGWTAYNLRGSRWLDQISPAAGK